MRNILFILTFCSLVIFTNCGGSSDNPAPQKTTVEKNNELVVAPTWKISSSTPPKFGGANSEGDWSKFTAKFTGTANNGGNYSVTNVPTGYERVWPTDKATWKWTGDTGTKMTRGDAVEMAVTVSENSMTLEFTIPEESGRTSGIAGKWVFQLSK